MREILLVAIGGAVGAVGRHGVGVAVASLIGPGFPWATLIVNAVGSLLLGALFEAGQRAAWASPDVRLLIGTGIMGAFTTFSTFSVETVKLAGTSGYGAAAANVAGNVILALMCAAIGIALARAALG